MSTQLYRLGHGSARHPWRVFAFVGLTLAGLFALTATVGGSPQNSVNLPGTSSDTATEMLEEHFADEANAHAYIAADWKDDRVDRDTVTQVASDMEGRGNVAVAVPQFSKDENIAVIAVTFGEQLPQLDAGGEIDELEKTADPLRDTATSVAVGGQLPESIQGPDGTAEAIGVAVALVILLFAFGSMLAAGFPLVIAGLGVGAGMGAIGLIAAITDVNTATPTLGAMIGLGVGIDYALFIVAGYRIQRHKGHSSVESAAVATATTGRSVVIAGITVLVGLLGLAFCGVPSFTTMGLAAGLVVVCEVLLAITVLPALLGRFGHRMRRPKRDPEQPTAWARGLAVTVTRRPVPWLIAGVAVLGLLSAPVTGMRLGQNDAGAESADSGTRQAYDTMAAGFGPGSTGPLTIVADREKLGENDPAALRERIADSPDVDSVTPERVSPDGRIAVYSVISQTRPHSEQTQQLVREIHDILPAGAEVTGTTAFNVDMADRLAQRLWLVVGVVLGLSFLLLVVMLRSLLIPLKAVALNLLAVGAAFGVITLAFQTELGARLVGLDGPVPIVGWAPLVLFAILFGLSMDYEIFLLSRIRDAWERTGDSTSSIITGLSDAARLITAAAAIMVAVALGFAFDSSVMVKVIGVGMAAALLLDATVVRLVLVPATMTLLGNRNWYLPQPLRRVLGGQPAAADHENAMSAAHK